MHPAQSRARAEMIRLLGVDPYDHQSQAVARGMELLDVHGSYLLSHEQGLGKTLSTLALFGILTERGDADTMLVVAPKSVVGSWQDECARVRMPLRVESLALGGAKLEAKLARIKLQRSVERPVDRMPLVCIINWDMLYRVEASLKAFGFDVIAADEVQKAKGVSSKQSRAIHRIGKRIPYRLGMSGTPAPESELEYFGVFRYLDDSLFGTSSVNFNSRFGITIPMGDFNKVIVNKYSLPELERIVHSRSHRVTKKQATDILDPVDVPRPFDLSPKARKLYDQIAKESIGFLEDEFGPTNIVSVDMVLARLMKLQQITSGFVMDDEGRIVWVHEDKLNATKAEVAEVLEAGGKCLVWHRFVEDGRRLREEVAKLVGSPKKPVEQPCIHGGVSAEDRREMVRRFQQDDDARVFVLQTQASATGITATAADTAIWHSFSFSSGEHSQGRARNHRIGTTGLIRHVYPEARGTVDGPHREAVLGKQKRSEMFQNDGFRRFLGG